MKENLIKLLNQQLIKINSKDFDLESWKEYTVIILSKILGNLHPRVKQIESLNFKFNSWSLRDASGNESYESRIKNIAKEIIQATIDEINTFGLPNLMNEGKEIVFNEILPLIYDELKGAQIKLIEAIIASEDNNDEKKRKISEIISTLNNKTAYEIITNILVKSAE